MRAGILVYFSGCDFMPFSNDFWLHLTSSCYPSSGQYWKGMGNFFYRLFRIEQFFSLLFRIQNGNKIILVANKCFLSFSSLNCQVWILLHERCSCNKINCDGLCLKINFVKSPKVVSKGRYVGQPLRKFIVPSDVLAQKHFYFSTKIIKITVYQTVKFVCQYVLPLLSNSAFKYSRFRYSSPSQRRIQLAFGCVCGGGCVNNSRISFV